MKFKKHPNVGWMPSAFRGEFNSREYSMFAALSNVCNDSDIEPLEDKGLPEDLSFLTFIKYYYRVCKEKEDQYTCSEEEAKKWVENKRSHLKQIHDTIYCSNPDWHSPNWCTLNELKKCYKKAFTDKSQDYSEWAALISYMKTLEKSGVYETRAVFWFDN